MNIIIREARLEDILQIQIIRNNTLSDPGLVTDRDCELFMFERGKGWVGEAEGYIVGFSIVDLKENNIWALFVHPDFEQTREKVWLGTSPQTRAETFYRKSG